MQILDTFENAILRAFFCISITFLRALYYISITFLLRIRRLTL